MPRLHFRSAFGFTLVELMTVVAIIGVLTVLAVVSYGRYTRRAVASEAMAMLGELRLKEEAYLTETGTYLSTGVDETAIVPLLQTPSGYHTRTFAPAATSPFTYLGVNPPRRDLYCGYVAIAGAAGSAPATGSAGAGILTNAPKDPSGNIRVPWFYARGCCDLQSPYASGGTCPSNGANISVYSVSFADAQLREENPGQ